MSDAPTPADPKDLLAIGLAGGSGPSPRWTPPAPADLPPIPNLEIGALLGHGGMGAVYRARQTHLDRAVALKILDPGRSAEPAFAERFAREARAMARLDHPAIVRLYDYGQTGSWPWLVMELVEGANLREVIRTGRLSAAEALRIAPLLCEALAHAHAAGVVHRDLKPENILIDAQGRPHIADFGLAKLADAGSALTATGQGCGTAVYMAPEQVAGAAGVDHRADLYALGVILYEMLTGALPLGRFAPPSQTAGVDRRLDEVVLKSLEREPGQRWQSAGEVQRAVEQASGGAAPPAARGKAVEDDAEAVATARANHRSYGSGMWFLVGGVLLATWLLIGPAPGPLMTLTWWAAAGLFAGGLSLVLRCWEPLAVTGGIAGLLAAPWCWTRLAEGFWGTTGALLLCLLALYQALRVFDLARLDRHYGSVPADQRRMRRLAGVLIAMVVGIIATAFVLEGGHARASPRLLTTATQPSSGIMTVSASEAGRFTLATFATDLPRTRQWHLRTRIRWQGVEGAAMLESWQRFTDGGSYFTRTLAENGPMAPFTGSSDAWREVVLPFDATGNASALTGVELVLVMAGPGRVEIEPVQLVAGWPR